MSDLDSVYVVGRFGIAVEDGPDVGDDPDVVWCDTGVVSLDPKQGEAKVVGGSPVPWTGGQSTFKPTIDAEGFLTWRGQHFIKLVDLTSVKVNPRIVDGKATHGVRFDRVKAGDMEVKFEQRAVRLAADMAEPLGVEAAAAFGLPVGTLVCDLTKLLPIPVANSVPIVRGETGTGITDALQPTPTTMALALSDGTTTSEIELPVGPGGSDAGVAGYLADPGSASNAAVTANIEAGMATVAKLLASGKPIHLLHSGNNLLAPDGTTQFYEAAASFGFGSLDVDVRSFAGCTTDLALLHDTTVDSATTSAGSLADQSPMSYRELLVDSSAWFRQGWGDTRLSTFMDLVTRYGNKQILWPEIKDPTTSVQDPVPILLKIIEQNHLEKSVVVCSAVFSALAPFAAKGIECCLVARADQIAGYTPAQLLDAGVRFAHFQGKSYVNDPVSGNPALAVSDATFQAFINAGVKVMPWTLGRQSEVKRYMDMGCVGAFLSSPYTAGDPSLYRRTTDPLVSNRQYHAPFLTSNAGGAKDDTYSDDARGAFGNGRHKSVVSGGGNTQYILQAWACPLVNPNTYAIDVDFVYDTPHTDPTKVFGILVGSDTDKAFLNTNTDIGYKVFMRQNGSMQVVRFNGTNQTSLGTQSTTALLTTPPLLSAALTTSGAIASLPVASASVPNAIPAGAKLLIPTTGGAGGKGQIVTVAAGGAAAGATSIPVASFTPSSAVGSGAALPQVVHFKVEVTPTAIKQTRTDTGESFQVTDAAMRGGYFHFFKEGGGSGNIVFSYMNAAVS